ncbi:hypothetical protein JOD03_000625 [Chryseomicrobium aureum]|uniref:hypothetical protein n=1 Tax=Chryseomicrobium aureum TaxID=1441723 RepID=UPI00195A6219|nr:hypothetical protein [Chryseomicrobium aureum]MBM7705742.1 hypothetical protein [Chryseomicrobium aureum]
MRYILVSLLICFICYAIRVDLEQDSLVSHPSTSNYSVVHSQNTSLEESYAASSSSLSFVDWHELVRQLNPAVRNFNEEAYVYPKWTD